VVFWGPLAWTIIFGLSFATLVTLLVVPVMYLLNEKIQAAFTGRDVNSPPPAVPADREEVEAATPPVLA
jgi:multidrug efflux pump